MSNINFYELMDILDKFTLTNAEKYDFRELEVSVDGGNIILIKGFEIVAVFKLKKKG